MDDSNAKKFQKDLNGGLVGLVLLAILAQSPDDLYGYEIAKRLARANEGIAIFNVSGTGVVSVSPDSTLQKGLDLATGPAAAVSTNAAPFVSAANLLTSRIVPSYAGPARRYYRITDQGRTVLAEWTAIWAGTRSFVDRFIEKGSPP